MYEQFFGFNERPFSIAPNPNYLFMTEQHREALAHLLYGIEGEGGVILLTGEVGTGKTTICRAFLSHIPDDVDVALIYNPKLSVEELLDSIFDELRLKSDDVELNTVKDYITVLNQRLLDAHADGRKTILIIDEAQNLEEDVLEQLRLLTNLETDERKLLQIVLLGQPELHEVFARQSMRQFSQRVTARFHLNHLSKSNIANYVNHRLRVAGAVNPVGIFSNQALAELYRVTGGIPRLINVVCDRALLGAYVQGGRRVNSAMMAKAAKEVMGDTRPKLAQHLAAQFKSRFTAMPPHWMGRAGAIAAALTVMTLVGLGGWMMGQRTTDNEQSVAEENTPNSVEQTASESTANSKAEPTSEPVVFRGDDTFQTAFAQLQGFWKMSAATPCDQVVQVYEGRGCAQLSGGWLAIQQLNRPVVIALHGGVAGGADGALDEGADMGIDTPVEYAVVHTLEMEHVILRARGRWVRVPRQWMEGRVADGFTVIFYAPPKYPGTMIEGMIGPSVQWLSEQMKALNPSFASDGSIGSYFDPRLAREVEKFQRARGLPATGQVDVLTLIRLNQALDAPGPRLYDVRRSAAMLEQSLQLTQRLNSPIKS